MTTPKTPRKAPVKRDSLTADERREQMLIKDRDPVLKTLSKSTAVLPQHATPAWWNRPFPALRFITLSDSYVWCDEHCEIHTATPDFYQDGSEQCGPQNWRAVFVATDDEGEAF